MNPERLKKIRIAISALLVAITLVFVSLSVMSASNYTEIAYAKLSAEASAEVHMAVARLEPTGEVKDDTIFWFNITFNVSNPSSRIIKLQFVTYQGSVRDYMTQDLFGGAGQRIFLSSLIRTYSCQSSQGSVQPGDRYSTGVSWVFDNTETSAFQATKRILNYALSNSSHLLRWDQVEWNHYFVFQMLVTGVPSDYRGPNSSYLIELPVIRRYQGDNSGVR